MKSQATTSLHQRGVMVALVRFAEMIEAQLPKPGKRGAYEKETQGGQWCAFLKSKTFLPCCALK